jgi:hypothetical protein
MEVKVLHIIPCDNMILWERKLHRMYGNKRVNGEWFNLDENDIAYIQSLTGDASGYKTIERAFDRMSIEL